MGKLAIAGGILLIIASFVLLFLFVIVDSSVPNFGVREMKRALVCSSGETYTEQLGEQVTNDFGRPAGAIFTAYCTAANGAERDVTGRAILIMGASFVLPLIGGLLLALSGIVALAQGGQRRKNSPTYNFAPASTEHGYKTADATSFDFEFPAQQQGNATYVTVTSSNLDQLPPEARETVNRILQGLGGGMSGAASDSNDLAGRLATARRSTDRGINQRAGIRAGASADPRRT